MRILTVLGTRPEAIKLAPLIQQLRRPRSQVESVVCSTGQHRELLDQALALFEIRPDIELNLMRPQQSLASLTARLFEGLDLVLQQVRPDWVVSQGDTTTAMVAAMVAFYQGVPFAHVEAGLRTGCLAEPFPEEANRVIADLVAQLRFAPTEMSRQRLLEGGADPSTVIVTGNTIVDALHQVARRPCDLSHGPLAGVPAGGRWVLFTAHRRENFGAPLRDIGLAIAELARHHSGVQFICPLHLNPQVRETLRPILAGIDNTHLLEPLDYVQLVHVLARVELVLTDSGGLQEEAPVFGKPLLVLRQQTERPEGVLAGAAQLVGTDRRQIVAAADKLLTCPTATSGDLSTCSLYGDGRAAERIAGALLSCSLPLKAAG